MELLFILEISGKKRYSGKGNKNVTITTGIRNLIRQEIKFI